MFRVISLFYRFGSFVKSRIKRGNYHGSWSTKNEVVGYVCGVGGIRNLIAIKDEQGGKQSLRLSKTLYQKPGYVDVAGGVYNLREDGVYRFYRLSDISEQRLVCSKGLDSLLGIIGYLWVYGATDRTLPVKYYDGLVRGRVLSTSCTMISEYALTVFAHYGISARLVCGLTGENRNGHDDGHSMLEVQAEKGDWFLYDPSHNCCFVRDGVRLSLWELWKNGWKNVEIEELPGNRGRGTFAHSGYSYDFWVDQRVLSKNNLLAWYQRVLCVPYCTKENVRYFPLPAIKNKTAERYEEYGQGLDEKVFYQEFYGT